MKTCFLLFEKLLVECESNPFGRAVPAPIEHELYVQWHFHSYQ